MGRIAATATADGRDDCAGAVKARVECAVGKIPGKTKIVGVCAVVTNARDDDRAVGLERNARRDIVELADGRDDVANAVKTRVEHAIGEVPSETKVVARADRAISGDDDLAVRLERDAGGVIFAIANRSDDYAGAVEGRVKRAASEITGKTKIVIRAVGAISSDDDLAVGLECEAGGDIAASAD